MVTRRKEVAYEPTTIVLFVSIVEVFIEWSGVLLQESAGKVGRRKYFSAPAITKNSRYKAPTALGSNTM